MTAATLRSRTAKDLAQLARQNGIAGWHSMRKEELVLALIKIANKRGAIAQLSNDKSPGASAKNSLFVSGATSPTKKQDSKIRRKIDLLQRKIATAKNIASNADSPQESKEDRLIVMVRDPYWLHAFWELSQRSVDRAQAALGQHWHSAQPTLRVFSIKETGTAVLTRNIVIHGGVSNWYVDVQDPPCEFRMEIGYLTENGSFYCIARSNRVNTPTASTSDAVDDNWTDVAEQADRIYAMSGGYSHRGTSPELQKLLEDRLQRPLGSPMKTRYGKGAASLDESADGMSFAVDAEIIVYGATDRHAHVTLKGEQVTLRPDGTFAIRMSLPDCRQVIPIVASTRDGVEQKTIILAVERNTKTMESVVRDVSKNNLD
ncbi:MAG: DUF4912 domain-containing protein [Planctomycetaceae bacterium]|nr:DUF4912 domain-containing protein [Planctomycetaceae bacterium]